MNALSIPDIANVSSEFPRFKSHNLVTLILLVYKNDFVLSQVLMYFDCFLYSGDITVSLDLIQTMRIRYLIGLLLLISYLVEADEHDHMYEIDEEVVLWMNTVGPYSNRQETYTYFSLPFCRGPKQSIGHYHETMGESLLGVELDFSGLDIKFRSSSSFFFSKFYQQYYFQLLVVDNIFDLSSRYKFFLKMFTTTFLSDIRMQFVGNFTLCIIIERSLLCFDLRLCFPITVGMIGEVDDSVSPTAYKLYTHKKLDIGYNDKQVVDVNLTSSGHVDIHPGLEIEFSYEVTWVQSSVLFSDRFDKYLDPSFFQHRIHWFSIFNSFMMVVFLVGLVWMILVRTLRKDYARYQKDESLDDIVSFISSYHRSSNYTIVNNHQGKRKPDIDTSCQKYKELAQGTTCLLTTVFACTFNVEIIEINVIQGARFSAMLLVKFLKDADLGDEYGWKQVHGDVFRAPTMPLLFASCIGAGYHVFTVAVITVILAIIGEFYTERGSLLSAAIFVYAASSPVNGYAGGSMYARFGGRHWIRQMALGAFLLPSLICGVAFLINFIAIYYHASRAIPFTVMLAVTAICLFVILPLTLVGTVLGRNMAGQGDYPCRYFIFTSFWAYKIYYVYGFMLLVIIILAIVTVCVTIVCCYFLLNAEDYRWLVSATILVSAAQNLDVT
ncbi:endomembrane protein 70 [Dictyocaulus viviparus]|uniref:Transmembrane 9 superfamily member n=1 Tax=Dictyocaulus viviparus TaxID=29172 RepID=A0A0D8XJS5_DICVI|nr:endomembrane protein 70 [Dictyocaulus viviparus]